VFEVPADREVRVMKQLTPGVRSGGKPAELITVNLGLERQVRKTQDLGVENE
jgi:hypothetical protein